MGTDSMARNCCRVGIALGFVRRFIGGRRSALAMVIFLRDINLKMEKFEFFLFHFQRIDSVQRLRFIGCHRFVAHVWFVLIQLGCSWRPLHGSSRLFGVTSTQ